MIRTLLTLSIVAISACRPGSGTGEPAAAEVPSAAPVRVVDSIRPLEDEVAQFRAAFAPDTPQALAGGAGSRDGLVRRWVAAIEQSDSAALREMLLDPAEYITFYYPESPYTRPPYRQSPSLRWHLISSTSSQGAGRVWQRHAGRPLGFHGYRCSAEPTVMGKNRIWGGCRVALEDSSGTREVRLFGPVIERDGRFKFLTYGSDY